MGASWFAWWKNEVTEQDFVDMMDRYGIDKACVNFGGKIGMILRE
jgi:hypothetical protein